jgi:hypothetical protein
MKKSLKAVSDRQAKPQSLARCLNYFLAALATESAAAFIAAESGIILAIESAAAFATESAVALIAAESTAGAAVSPEPQAAKAPNTKTNNSFFIVFCFF